jgi:hypothetical protein
VPALPSLPLSRRTHAHNMHILLLRRGEGGRVLLS